MSTFLKAAFIICNIILLVLCMMGIVHHPCPSPSEKREKREEGTTLSRMRTDSETDQVRVPRRRIPFPFTTMHRVCILYMHTLVEYSYLVGVLCIPYAYYGYMCIIFILSRTPQADPRNLPMRCAVPTLASAP